MNKDKFIIKRVGKEESEQVSSLVIALLIDMNSRRNDKFIMDMEGYKRAAYELLSRENGFTAFLAYDIDKPKDAVGLLTIVLSSAIYNFGDFGTITELFVIPEYRSNGIGSLLIKRAKEFCLQMGWRKIEVGAPVSEEWPKTIEFYKANNFKEKGPKLRLDIIII